MSKKPKTLKEAISIIEGLEERLDKYDNKKTMARFYLGLKSQLDYFSKLMISLSEEEDDVEDEDEKARKKREYKREKQFERMVRFQERSKAHIESLVFIKESIDPEVVEALEAESGSIFEEIKKAMKEDATA